MRKLCHFDFTIPIPDINHDGINVQPAIERICFVIMLMKISQELYT